MPDFPIMLRIENRVCVVVGGGGVALRRARALHECGARVRVVAPHVEADIETYAHEIHRRAFTPNDLADASLVVVATDDAFVNEAVAAEARVRAILVNRADDPDEGDFTVPAHSRVGPLTLCVHTAGVSAAAAVAIRDQLGSALDPDWPRLLACVAPFRPAIQREIADANDRRRRLLALADADAMRTLKEQGEPALLDRCRRLADPHARGQ